MHESSIELCMIAQGLPEKGVIPTRIDLRSSTDSRPPETIP